MPTLSTQSNVSSATRSSKRSVASSTAQNPQEILQSSPTTLARLVGSNNKGATDTISEVSASSSVGWSGDYCKKMMALNWDYTAGPLRVVQVGPHNHHWARLHAPGHAVLPRADGTLQHFRETHKHVTDEELLKKVMESGVSKTKKDPKEKLLAPVKFSIKDEDVDKLKDTLTRKSVPLPPARPPQTVFNRVQEFDDASSIFSQTDVASVMSRRTSTTIAAGVSNFSGSRSAAGASNSKKRAADQLQEQLETASAANSTSSSKRPPSRQEREAQKALSVAKAENESVSSELARAKEKLAQIERIVEEHESSKRGSRQGSARTSAVARATQGVMSANKKNKSIIRQSVEESPLSRQSPALNQRELSNSLNASRKALTPFC